MLDQLTKKPFKDRLKDTGYLIKNSFTIVGKDKDIKTPTIHMCILSIIITTFVFFSIFTFFTGVLVGVGIVVLLITIFILFPFKFFYYVRKKADQSWIVYNTLVGKDISYSDAHQHTGQEKGKLRLIAVIDIIMVFVGAQRGKTRGIIGIIINLLISALLEVWDLLSHYMLPAVVIEQKSIKELVPRLKALKNNIPATLAGVFGIDFVGNIISTILIPVYALFLALSVGIGYLVALGTSSTAIEFAGITFSWVPILLMMYVIFVAGGIIRKIVESIKVIYFTIFYTSLTRPQKITPSIRKELTNYLLMKPSDFKPQKTPSSRNQYIAKLREYIISYKKSGGKETEIVKFLKSRGYKQKDIDEALFGT